VSKLTVRDVYKVFGPQPQKVRALIEAGRGKDEIFAETGHTVGVQAASFAIEEGEVFVIMGLSGSGKSTMVRMLNRLIDPTWGAVEIDGQDITQMSTRELTALRRRDMSMVFQSFALMPHQSVLHNTAFGLEVAGIPRSEYEERALRALEQVGLRANAHSYPDELSGGMKQRVGLARALAVDPSILLMDEAFSALDPLIRTQMQDELLELQREHRRTIVFISHDLDEAMRIGDRIAIMQDGRVVQIGTPQEIVTQPANDYVRSFFHGVDVTQVFGAGDLADPECVAVIGGRGSQAASTRAGAPAVLVADDGAYRGMVANGAADTEPDPAAPAAVRGDTDLHTLIGQVAHSDWPVPVIDEHGRYLGSVSKSALLETLNRAG